MAEYGFVTYPNDVRGIGRARSAASARADARRARMPATTARRLQVTGAIFALIALAVLLLAAPLAVTVPLGFVFGAGAAVSAIVALVERRTRGAGSGAPDDDPGARRAPGAHDKPRRGKATKGSFVPAHQGG